MRMHLLLCITTLLSLGASAGAATWDTTVLIESPRGMGGAAVGDLDPRAAGLEVAAVDGSGAVWMSRRHDDAWRSERIHQAGGELIMCAIGDVAPHHPGNEFVGVGMVHGPESLTGAGQVLMLHREGDAWVATRIFEDTHMIHGVAVGDVSSRHPGNEIIACGFNHRVNLLAYVDGVWTHETIYVGNDRMKIAAVADVLPAREGLEVVVSGTDGNALVLWEDELGWRHETIYAHTTGQSRIACGAGGVLIGGDDGQVTFARRTDCGWQTTFLMRDAAKIRGVAVADIGGAGPAFFAGGYSCRVHRLALAAGGLCSNEPIYVSEKPLHHLLAGDVDPAHPGAELIACGHAGRVILLTPRRDDR